MATRNQQEHCPHGYGHGHQLQLMKVPAGSATYSFYCDGCKERGIGDRYCCDTCTRFNLHKECHNPPLTLKSHHFPPEFKFDFLRQLPPSSTSCFCVACREGVFGFVYQYSCSKDKKLYLHPCCTNLKLHFRYKDADLHLKDEVVAHDHPQLGTKPCFYCKKTALSGQGQGQGQGQGWSYMSIDPVVYRIHVYCSMEMEMEMEIKKHPADDESLVLLLDTTKTTTSMATTKYGQYCRSGHQLKLTDGPIKNKKTDFFKCDGCMEKGFRHRFRCDACDFDLHKKCYQPSPTIQNPHFPGHTFNFLPHLSSPGGSCNACGKEVKGCVYHCKDRGWNLHPCCNHLPHKIKFTKDKPEILFLHKDHHDRVTSSKKIKDCFQCKKTTLSGTDKGVPGLSYVSSCGGYRCHVYCFMERLREIIRSRETGSLTPISSKRNGNGRGRSSNTNGEYYWSFANSMLGFVSGDPTALFLECIYQMLDA